MGIVPLEFRLVHLCLGYYGVIYKGVHAYRCINVEPLPYAKGKCSDHGGPGSNRLPLMVYARGRSGLSNLQTVDT